MYLLIVLTPLISSLIVISSGRYLTPNGSMLLTTSCIFFNFLMSCVAFYEVALSQSPVYIKVFSWLNCEMLDFSWGFLFDSLTVIMLVIVNCVSCVVHTYSMDYMEADPHKARFFSYLSLFTFLCLY
jgi:NADH-ubiquinone oxidoreductase chain 5